MGVQVLHTSLSVVPLVDDWQVSMEMWNSGLGVCWGACVAAWQGMCKMLVILMNLRLVVALSFPDSAHLAVWSGACAGVGTHHSIMPHHLCVLVDPQPGMKVFISRG